MVYPSRCREAWVPKPVLLFILQKQGQLLLSYYRVIKTFQEVLRTKQFSLHGAIIHNMDESALTALHCALFSSLAML